jgi:hypothetical protein
MKKTILVSLFALLFFSPVLADPVDSECFDCAYLYIDMRDRGGYIEVYYVNCDGKSREATFERESGYVFVDTDYSVLLIARPYDDYHFLGWGDDDYRSRSIEIYLCEDLFLVPRFRDIYDHRHNDDDYSCFIQNLK